MEKKLYGFLRYLIDDYEHAFNIEYIIKYINEFKKIPYIRNDDVKDFLRDKLDLQYGIDFDISDGNLNFWSEKSYVLIKNIEDKIREGLCDFSELGKILNKCEIGCITKRNRNDVFRRRKILYKNKFKICFAKNEESYNKFDLIKMNGNIREQDLNHQYDYRDELERAWINCYLEKYYEAYKIYKEISNKSLNNREFVIYAISEFNRFYIGKILINDYYIPENIRSAVKGEVDKIELDKIPLKFPFNSVELKFIKLILNWNFDDSRMLSIKRKVDSDEQTTFISVDEDSIGIKQAEKYVHSLKNFIKYNYLSISRYSEVRRVFYNYIDIIMKDYSMPGVRIDRNKSLFGERAVIIKKREISINDIRYIIDYLDRKEIENIFQRYEIKWIDVCEEDIQKFIEIVKNYFNYVIINQRFFNIEVNKLLILLSSIKLNDTQILEIVKIITDFIKVRGMDIGDYKYINKFVYKQCAELKTDDDNCLLNLLLIILERNINDDTMYNDKITLIHNLV